MGRDEGRSDKRRDRRDRSRNRRRERSRSRSRSRERVASFRNRSRSRSRSRDRRHGASDANRRDHRRDDRRDRDNRNDRVGYHGDRERLRESRKADTPEPPRANKFFDRARKLGIVPEAIVNAAAVSSSSSEAEQTTSNTHSNAAPPNAISQTSTSAASLAAARALALSASLSQSGASRSPVLGLPLGSGPAAGLAGVGGAPATHPDVPSYYNPATVNTQRIADQIKKRKMLWTRPGAEESAKQQPTPSASQPKDSNSQEAGGSSTKYWAKATFKGDDGTMTAKFRKLMGIKDDVVVKEPPPDASKILDEQDQLFKHLDQQYQAARATTHTQRGMGLGWGH